MERTLVRKVVIYCVSDERLLVMSHPDFAPEAVGIQAPAGTIRVGESPEVAALRELEEETGYTGFSIVRFLGNSEYDISPYRFEQQQRYFFLARPPAGLPERWLSAEDHDGRGPATRLQFFWIPLESAHVLQSGQGALVGRLFDGSGADDDRGD